MVVGKFLIFEVTPCHYLDLNYLANSIPAGQDAPRNFFTDFHGLQRLETIPEKPEVAGKYTYYSPPVTGIVICCLVLELNWIDCICILSMRIQDQDYGA